MKGFLALHFNQNKLRCPTLLKMLIMQSTRRIRIKFKGEKDINRFVKRKLKNLKRENNFKTIFKSVKS